MLKLLDEIVKLRGDYVEKHHKSPTRVLIDDNSLATYLAHSYYNDPQYNILGLEVFVKYLPCGVKEKIIIVE